VRFQVEGQRPALLVERDVLGPVEAVQEHADVAAVGVLEAGRLDVARIPRGEQVDRPRLHEARHVADPRIRRRQVQLARGTVEPDRAAAEVARVVGSALGVEQDVPVDPSPYAGLEVADQVVGVVLGQTDLIVLLARELAAALRHDELAVGPATRRLAERLEVVAGIPVEGDAVHDPRLLRLRGILRVGLHLPCAEGLQTTVDDAFLVVVPHQDAHIGEPLCIESGAQLACQRHLVGCAHQARFPQLPGLRFVLQRHPRHRQAEGAVLRGVACQHVRPHPPVAGLQVSAPAHQVVGLHPAGRAPRRGEQLQTGIGGRGIAQHRHEVAQVARE